MPGGKFGILKGSGRCPSMNWDSRETAMTFEQAYAKLEEKFRRQVARDEKRWGVESVYLPTVVPSGLVDHGGGNGGAEPGLPTAAPNGRVDYVLVAMEPSSMGARSKDEAQRLIDEGFRNFCNSTEDFILHFCARNYLCRSGETYHVTDLAKGTMPTKAKAAGNPAKYCDWYPLFKEELRLIAKPNAKIISIGKVVGQFLCRKGLRGHVGTILHYSPRAASHRGRAIVGRKAEYERFASSLHELPKGESCSEPKEAIPLSESQKKLAFTYKVSFEHFRDRNLGNRRGT